MKSITFLHSDLLVRLSSQELEAKILPDLPLLLLRILLFLIIAALLADPYWKSESVPALEKSGEEVLIMIDVSGIVGWNGLQEAKEEAAKILNKKNAKIGLLTFGHSTLSKIEMGQGWTDEKINEISHDWSRGNAQEMLDRVSTLFAQNTTSRKLVIIVIFKNPIGRLLTKI